MFFTFLKLYKRYQIEQRITYCEQSFSSTRLLWDFLINLSYLIFFKQGLKSYMPLSYNQLYWQIFFVTRASIIGRVIWSLYYLTKLLLLKLSNFVLHIKTFSKICLISLKNLSKVFRYLMVYDTFEYFC